MTVLKVLEGKQIFIDAINWSSKNQSIKQSINQLANQSINQSMESHSGDTTLCDKVCQWLTTGRWFSPGTQVFPTNKTPPRYNWNIVESDVKYHKSNLT
jgi:hypothetical protein